MGQEKSELGRIEEEDVSKVGEEEEEAKRKAEEEERRRDLEE